MSAPADPLGLLADDGEEPGIAWCRRDGGEHLVQGLGHDRRRRASPDTPRRRFVDQAGRGHRPDVGLPADAPPSSRTGAQQASGLSPAAWPQLAG
jgi:hypothetical protein